MAKFNVVKRERRVLIQQRKREIHGDRTTRKLKLKIMPVSVSGKRKRKIFKKWRREQKEALQKGLVTMEDVEMAVAEGASQETSDNPRTKFHLKKGSKIRIKQLKGKGKNKRKSTKPTTASSVDSMEQ